MFLVVFLIVWINVVQSQHLSAILYSSSTGYYNHRQTGNVIKFYRDLKQKYNWDDESILLQIPQNTGCCEKNPIMGSISYLDNEYTNVNSELEIDMFFGKMRLLNVVNSFRGKYQKYALNLEKLKHHYSSSNQKQYLLLFQTGHGGDYYFKIRERQAILDEHMKFIFQEIDTLKQYDKVFVISDSCSAITPFETVQAENFIALGSSSFDQKSISLGFDQLYNSPKLDTFSFHLSNLITENNLYNKKISIKGLKSYMDPQKLSANAKIHSPKMNPSKETINEFFVPKSTIKRKKFFMQDKQNIQKLIESLPQTQVKAKKLLKTYQKLENITKFMQIGQKQSYQQIALSIANLIISQETNPVIIEQKIKNIGQRFLTNQIKLKLPLEDRQLYQDIKTKQKKFLQQINRLEIDQPNNVYLKNQIYLKRKYLSLKQQEIKTKYKLNFEPGQTQSDVRISTDTLDIQKIKKKIERAVGKSSLVKITIDKVKSRQEGGPQQFNIKTQIQVNQLQSYLKKFLDNLGSFTSEVTTAGNTQFFQAIKSYWEKIQLNCQQLQNQKKNLQNQLIFNQYASKQIDLCIVMDTTNSMGPYISQAKTDSIGIINKFKQSYPDSSIKYSFISYKDHCQTQVVQYYDFDNSEGIQNKINRVSAYAKNNYDFPEAVHDGLWAATKLSWRPKSTKFVFLIFDAPPHGKQYSDMHDTYPNGCPCGIKLSQIAKYYNSNKIHLNVKACGSQIGRTSQVFEIAFRNDLYGVSELKASDFSASISQEIKKKIQQISAQLLKNAQDFSTMINKLLKIVQQDLKELIKNEQQINQLSQYFSQIKEVQQYLDGIKNVKQQSEKLAQIQQDESNIPKMSESLSQVLATAKKVNELKKKEDKLKELMQQHNRKEEQNNKIKHEKNINGLVEQYSQDIKYLQDSGLGLSGISKFLQRKGIDHETALIVIERAKKK